MTVASAAEAFIRELDEAVAPLKSAIENHPFILGIEQGTLPRERVRHYAAQLYYGVRETVARRVWMANHAPDEEALELLVKHAYEETGHPALARRFCAQLGVDMRALLADELITMDTEYANAWTYRLAHEASVGEFMAAMAYVNEDVFGTTMGRVGRGLRDHYGVRDEALEFFGLHEEVDKGHSEYGRLAVLRWLRTPEEQQRAKRIAVRKLESAKRFYDALWRGD